MIDFVIDFDLSKVVHFVCIGAIHSWRNGDIEGQVDAVVIGNGIDGVRNEVVGNPIVAMFMQMIDNPAAFVFQNTDIQRHALVEQRMLLLLLNQLADGVVVEFEIYIVNIV